MGKKILIIGNNSGGTYHFRGALISQLVKIGHEVTVLTPFDTNVEDLRATGAAVREITMDRRGINPFHDYNLYRKYRKILKELSPDLVITYTIKPNIYGGYACKRAGIPYAANITGLGTAFQKEGLLRKLVTTMYTVSLKKADTVFFENSENRNLFVNEKIITDNQAYCLAGAGVDLEHFHVLPYPTEGPVRFLFIGRVMREKGIDELLNAMKVLRAEGETCELDILGDFEEDYKQVIDQAVSEGWLHYYGFQTEIRPFIQNSHCFVLPSWHEGMANTNLECAASGRPVITSDIPGCREAVVSGKSGFLCKTQNVDDLKKVLKKFIKLSNIDRQNMGQAGRRHMEEVFDKRKVVGETIRRLRVQE